MELKPGGVDAAAIGAKGVGGIEGRKGVGRGEKERGCPGDGLAPQCQVQIPGGRPAQVESIEAVLPAQMVPFPKVPLEVQPRDGFGKAGDRQGPGSRLPVQAEGMLVSDLQGKGPPARLAHQPEAVEVAEESGAGWGRPAPQGKVVVIAPDQGSLGRCRTGISVDCPQGQEECRGNYCSRRDSCHWSETI